MYRYHIDDQFKSGESVVMTESPFVPNSLVDHEHDYLEIAYIQKGVGEHKLNGKSHKVKKGDVFFIARNSVHNYNAISPDFSWINCLFLPNALSKDAFCENAKDIVRLAVFSNIFEIQKITSESIELQPGQDEFGALFCEMLNEYREGKSGAQEVLKHYLSILCIKLFRRYATQNEQKKQNDDPDYARLVIEYLENNAFEKFEISEIAKKVFLSPHYFQTLFKKKTGKSLVNFLHEIRVDKAKKLLETTDMPISAIMLAVGYNDTKFFYNIFKRYTGLTPGAYRDIFTHPAAPRE